MSSVGLALLPPPNSLYFFHPLSLFFLVNFNSSWSNSTKKQCWNFDCNHQIYWEESNLSDLPFLLMELTFELILLLWINIELILLHFFPFSLIFSYGVFLKLILQEDYTIPFVCNTPCPKPAPSSREKLSSCPFCAVSSGFFSHCVAAAFWADSKLFLEGDTEHEAWFGVIPGKVRRCVWLW